MRLANMVTQPEEEEIDQSFSMNYKEKDNEENVVKFLDSMDAYLILMDSLSSILRQGWLELASARHSMGASRISSSLFNLKDHSAATTLQLHRECVDSESEELVFKLQKWVSSDSSKSLDGEVTSEDGELLPSESNGPSISQNYTSENYDIQEKKTGNNGSSDVNDNQVQKQRLKTLSMFGALFPPKLRAAQLSFETALETLVEIANTRASLLAAYEQVHKEMESSRK